ncbi:MAG: hypothetical protein M3680_20165 [Myxococcota bacterium]|nr:hypothetical protein [Myxococcota bacterium]
MRTSSNYMMAGLLVLAASMTACVVGEETETETTDLDDLAGTDGTFTDEPADLDAASDEDRQRAAVTCEAYPYIWVDGSETVWMHGVASCSRRVKHLHADYDGVKAANTLPGRTKYCRDASYCAPPKRGFSTVGQPARFCVTARAHVDGRVKDWSSKCMPNPL